MLVIGLTGGIACGKSTAAAALSALGAPIFDADAISRALTSAGGEASGEVLARFGTLDRRSIARAVFSDPAAHDERIAYTSQLMHVMALALCDQHLLFDSYGFEGGSFRGATRVAALDPKLWCELFWANKETLANLTDELTERLAEYSALLHGDDRAALLERLTVSSDRKKKFDALRGLDASQKPLFK